MMILWLSRGEPQLPLAWACRAPGPDHCGLARGEEREPMCRSYHVFFLAFVFLRIHRRNPMCLRE